MEGMITTRKEEGVKSLLMADSLVGEKSNNTGSHEYRTAKSLERKSIST